MAAGNRWSREELLEACALYFAIPFGQMHSRNPEVCRLAGALGRTPSSVAMKLVNFASLDPDHQQRGVRGLSGASKADEEIFAAFRSNWLGDRAALLAVRRLAENLQETEALRTAPVRLGQWYFRKMVLSAYGSRCCLTGNPIPGLLVASHILPWSRFREHRLEPTNGLCLSATFDRAFDQGLIAFDDSFRLLGYLPSEAVETEFQKRRGQPISLPDRFAPNPEFLRIHRREIFHGAD